MIKQFAVIRAQTFAAAFMALSIALFMAFAALAPAALAAEAMVKRAGVSIDTRGPAIGGYSPVSYHTVGRAERGDPAYSVVHDGKTWQFTSPAQRALFEADPERYLPLFGASCAYNLASGQDVPIDPTSFKVVGGQLLLFHKSDAGDGLSLWNNSSVSETELLRRATGQYRLLEF